MTKQSNYSWVNLVLIAVGGLILSPAALGQDDTSTRLTGATAFDNLGRVSPGSMVSRGVRRALDHGDQGLTSVLAPDITETEPFRSVGDQWRIDSIEPVAEEISFVILFLVNQWFARVGIELFPDADAVRTAIQQSPPLTNGDNGTPSNGDGGDGSNGDGDRPGPSRPPRKAISSSSR